MYDALHNLMTQGKTTAEIADITKIPAPTLRTVMHMIGLKAKDETNGYHEQFIQWLQRSTNTPIEINHIENNITFDIWLPNLNLGFDVIYPQDARKHVLQMLAIRAYETNVAKSFITPRHLCDSRFMHVLKTQLKARQTRKQIIGARKLTIKTVNSKATRSFLKAFHFQGAYASTHNYALTHDDQIVALLTIGKSRFQKNAWEIHRYCTNPYWAISGGFERLLHKARQTIGTQYNTLETYMDLNVRLANSNIYEKTQFTYDGLTMPDYYWTRSDGQQYLSRYQTTKKQLIRQGYDEQLTERQIMQQRGFIQTFGAGSIRYFTTI